MIPLQASVIGLRWSTQQLHPLTRKGVRENRQEREHGPPR
jgi:hypothetical protein